jgi:hypothetical protein
MPRTITVLDSRLNHGKPTNIPLIDDVPAGEPITGDHEERGDVGLGLLRRVALVPLPADELVALLLLGPDLVPDRRDGVGHVLGGRQAVAQNNLPERPLEDRVDDLPELEGAARAFRDALDVVEPELLAAHLERADLGRRQVLDLAHRFSLTIRSVPSMARSRFGSTPFSMSILISSASSVERKILCDFAK